MGYKHSLLASFVEKERLDEALERIQGVTGVPKGRIFVFRSDDTDEMILTYNIDCESLSLKFSEIWSDTISVHRKKETNTLFSLNALNELIKLENDGKLVQSHKIDWDRYRNSFLLFRAGSLNVLRLELIKLNR